MKKLLKSEICGSRAQFTRPTDVLKSQIVRLLFMNSSRTISLNRCQKKRKTQHNKHCIQTNTKKSCDGDEAWLDWYHFVLLIWFGKHSVLLDYGLMKLLCLSGKNSQISLFRNYWCFIKYLVLNSSLKNSSSTWNSSL